MYLYVENNDEENAQSSCKITKVIVVNEEGEKSDLKFTNDYGKTYDTIHDVTITKNVTGNQGDKTKDFEFYLTVDSSESEKYYVTFSDNRTPVTLIAGKRQTIVLSNGESATIHGLSANDKYTVEEKSYTDEGYTTTITPDNKQEATVDSENTNKISGISKDDKATIIVKNDKTTSAPTGIAMTYGPYALMVALAGGMAVLFFRRRNREDY